MRILILGGTGEARDLAGRLVALGHEVTTSLAGRTSRAAAARRATAGRQVRRRAGPRRLSRGEGFERLVDATHPYAGLISINAVAAAQQARMPLVRFMRAALDRAGRRRLAVMLPDRGRGCGGAAARRTWRSSPPGMRASTDLLARADCRLLCG